MVVATGPPARRMRRDHLVAVLKGWQAVKRWKVAGLIAGCVVAGWLVAVAVTIGVMVKGGRLIEEASTEWED